MGRYPPQLLKSALEPFQYEKRVTVRVAPLRRVWPLDSDVVPRVAPLVVDTMEWEPWCVGCVVEVRSWLPQACARVCEYSVPEGATHHCLSQPRLGAEVPSLTKEPESLARAVLIMTVCRPWQLSGRVMPTVAARPASTVDFQFPPSRGPFPQEVLYPLVAKRPFFPPVRRFSVVVSHAPPWL